MVFFFWQFDQFKGKYQSILAVYYYSFNLKYFSQHKCECDENNQCLPKDDKNWKKQGYISGQKTQVFQNSKVIATIFLGFQTRTIECFWNNESCVNFKDEDAEQDFCNGPELHKAFKDHSFEYSADFKNSTRKFKCPDYNCKNKIQQTLDICNTEEKWTKKTQLYKDSDVEKIRYDYTIQNSNNHI